MNNQKYKEMPVTMKLFCEENQNSIIACDFYMHHGCKETCIYAREILGIGAADQGTAKRINKSLDKLAEGD